jgi:hypothetical protein
MIYLRARIQGFFDVRDRSPPEQEDRQKKDKRTSIRKHELSNLQLRAKQKITN